MQFLNPLVVVDESHNAETDLSVDMLKDLIHVLFSTLLLRLATIATLSVLLMLWS